MQIFIAFILAALIGLAAWRAKALSISGAIGAAALGTIVFGLGGFSWAVLLIAFFVTSSGLSFIFKKRKQAFDEKFSKGTQRDAWQVAANGGVAGICVLLHVAFPEAAWPWMGFAAALAAANADTWATELGVLSPGAPRLITTGKPVEGGTSGAISVAGTLAAFSGALLIALLALIFWAPRSAPVSLAQQAGIVGLISLGGLFGSMLDSWLGATAQAIYWCPACNKETERHPNHLCGTATTPLRGWPWLNNDRVNMACTLGGLLFTGILFSVIPGLTGVSTGGTMSQSILLSSTAFNNGQPIPAEYTCSGADLSPALTWGTLPAGTKSLALIVDDPDAPSGNWVHWVLYNIAPTRSDLPKGVAQGASISGIGTQGTNDFRKPGYNGPCPPAGSPHRYYFTLYALDVDPTLAQGMTKNSLLRVLQGHILGMGEWMGTFRR